MFTMLLKLVDGCVYGKLCLCFRLFTAVCQLQDALILFSSLTNVGLGFIFTKDICIKTFLEECYKNVIEVSELLSSVSPLPAAHDVFWGFICCVAYLQVFALS